MDHFESSMDETLKIVGNIELVYKVCLNLFIKFVCSSRESLK